MARAYTRATAAAVPSCAASCSSPPRRRRRLPVPALHGAMHALPATPTEAALHLRHLPSVVAGCCAGSASGSGDRSNAGRDAAAEDAATRGSVLRDSDALELRSFLRMVKARRQATGQDAPAGPGHVCLIGTGPGDPGLLTLRAVRLMQTADVVLYDRLVSDDILRLVHPGARMVYVGKEAGFHTRTQDEIHTLLTTFAEAGASVIRLKGGDPYVFGRGGEEVAYLQVCSVWGCAPSPHAGA